MNKYNVLMVDDEPEFLKIGKFIFSKDDKFAVFSARDSKEAFNVLQVEQIDLVLLDVVLGYENGIELIGAIKEKSLNKDVIIYLMSAIKIKPEQVVKGIDAGADDYITRPFNSTILKTRIQKNIDRKKELLTSLKLGQTFKEIINSEKESLFFADHEGMILASNKKALVKYGQCVQKITGPYFGELLSDEKSKKIWAEFLTNLVEVHKLSIKGATVVTDKDENVLVNIEATAIMYDGDKIGVVLKLHGN